jgi:hypothetical protein
MRARDLVAALVIGAIGCGDDAAAPDGGFDSGLPDAGFDAAMDDAGPISCDTIADRTNAFIEANKACTEDSDCVGAEVRCAMSFEEACCYTYLSNDVDIDEFLALTGRLRECAGMTCECCASPRPDPACVGGLCGPGAM